MFGKRPVVKKSLNSRTLKRTRRGVVSFIHHSWSVSKEHCFVVKETITFKIFTVAISRRSHLPEVGLLLDSHVKREELVNLVYDKSEKEDLALSATTQVLKTTWVTTMPMSQWLTDLAFLGRRLSSIGLAASDRFCPKSRRRLVVVQSEPSH